MVASGGGVVGGCFASREWSVGARWKDTIEPALFVFVTRSCESSARELFTVEAVGRFLRRIGTDRKCAFNRFRPISISVSPPSTLSHHPSSHSETTYS